MPDQPPLSGRSGVAEAGVCEWCGCHFRVPSDVMRHCCAAMQEAMDAARRDAFEDKVLALREAWLADEDGGNLRGLNHHEAQLVLLFAVDLATYAKGVMSGDIEANA